MPVAGIHKASAGIVGWRIHTDTVLLIEGDHYCCIPGTWYLVLMVLLSRGEIGYSRSCFRRCRDSSRPRGSFFFSPSRS